jgi:hypothetical protein
MTTTNNWKVNAGGDWATVADWSLGRLPNSGDVVTISTANVQAITHDSGSDIIDKLTVGRLLQPRRREPRYSHHRELR